MNRPWTPPPGPLTIEKGRFRLLFSEPHEQGCVMVDVDGTGGVCIFLDDDELMQLSGAALRAARRIRRNRAG